MRILRLLRVMEESPADQRQAGKSPAVWKVAEKLADRDPTPAEEIGYLPALFRSDHED